MLKLFLSGDCTIVVTGGAAGATTLAHLPEAVALNGNDLPCMHVATPQHDYPVAVAVAVE